MKTLHISQLFASNLREAMKRKYGLKKNGEVNQSSLAEDSHVDQKSISNYLGALKPDNKLNPDALSSPSLVSLAKMAEALGMQPWELIHPDINKAMREQELYRRIEREFQNLPKLDVKEDLAEAPESANSEKYRWEALGEKRDPSPAGFFAGAGTQLADDSKNSKTSNPKNKKT